MSTYGQAQSNLEAFDRWIEDEIRQWHREQFDALKHIIAANLGGEKPVSNEMKRRVTKVEVGVRGRYQSRRGYPVTIFAVNLRDSDGGASTAVGVEHLPSSDLILTWALNGNYYKNGQESDRDLFETVREAEPIVQFINVYSDGKVGGIHKDEEAARRGLCGGGETKRVEIPNHSSRSGIVIKP